MNPDNHTWDLLVGALKGTLGEAEQREFDRWAAEAENRRFYNNLEFHFHILQSSSKWSRD